MSGRLIWHGNAVSGAVRKAAAAGLLAGAEHLLEEANRTVPLEEGTLARSGTTSVDAGQLTAAVAYDTPYARRLHEHPEYQFQHGRRGKWLELTARERSQAVRDFIAAKVRGALA